VRIALVSDIHGNLAALRAVLTEIAKIGVDRVACLGDVATLGPLPVQTLHEIRELGCPCVMGNHDAFLLDPDLILTYKTMPVINEAVDWCRGRMGADDLDFIRSFSPMIELPLEGGLRLLLYHGSPRSFMDDILSATPSDEVDRMLDGKIAPVMAGGHTHIPMLRRHGDIMMINPGSVGFPFREYAAGKAPVILDHAEFAIVESEGTAVSAGFHHVPVDKNGLFKSMSASDNPLRDLLPLLYR
jgi:putative phosphoesterase